MTTHKSGRYNHNTSGKWQILHREFLWLNKENRGPTTEIWTKDLNLCDSQKRPSKWQINLKRCPASLVIRDMQIKTTMWYNSIHMRMSTMKKMTIPGPGGDMEQLELSYTAGGMNCYNLLEDYNYLLKPNVGIPMTQQFQSNRNAYIYSPGDRYQNLHSFNICNC